jgi:hypothetical protein
MSRDDIANYLVINCDTLSRTMMKFCDSRLIERESRHAIRIIDLEALKKISPPATLLSAVFMKGDSRTEIPALAARRIEPFTPAYESPYAILPPGAANMLTRSGMEHPSASRGANREGGETCGIVGVVSRGSAAAPILDALRRLEYRGYDSAGIATLESGQLTRRRAVGKLENLAAKLANRRLAGPIGIGHTRWATHGRPTENNAHLHAVGGVAVVRNGIIENHHELRKQLKLDGARFVSETDTEVIAHLVSRELKRGCQPVDAVRAALPRFEGSFALAFLFEGYDNLIVGARKGSTNRLCPRVSPSM